MTDNNANADETKALFANLVIMLSTSAMQQMGKIVNPLTGKAEVNLQGAQMSIDMLSMLQAKTNGNLDPDEQSMLNDILANLQMNYVETARNAPQGEHEAEEEEPEAQPSPSAEQTGTSAPTAEPEVKGTGEDREPKFHKSYGG